MEKFANRKQPTMFLPPCCGFLRITSVKCQVRIFTILRNPKPEHIGVLWEMAVLLVNEHLDERTGMNFSNPLPAVTLLRLQAL